MTTPAGPLRFALLRHDCADEYRDGPHWDLMLERAGTPQEHRLATWSLQELPGPWFKLLGRAEVVGEAEQSVRATRLDEHRARYLDYEGPISGDRGRVERWAGGPIEWLEEGADRIEVRLSGALSGVVEISSLVEPGGGPEWRLSWRP